MQVMEGDLARAIAANLALMRLADNQLDLPIEGATQSFSSKKA
jgi:hypothetical protein